MFENGVRNSLQDDYYFGEPHYVIFPQKYIFPIGIKNIEAVTTYKGITKRNLLIITPNNQVT